MNPDEKKLQARQAIIALLAIGAMTPNGEPRYSADLEELYRNDPCKTCSNNPKNGGSGICHCTLGMPKEC